MMDASLAAKSTCLDESMAECAELFHLLAEASRQKEKDLAEMWAMLNEVEVRATKIEKVLNKGCQGHDKGLGNRGGTWRGQGPGLSYKGGGMGSRNMGLQCSDGGGGGL